MSSLLRNSLLVAASLLILLALFVVRQIDTLGVYRCSSATITGGRCHIAEPLTLTVDDQWEFLGKNGTYSIHYENESLQSGFLRFEGDASEHLGDANFSDGMPPSTLTFQGIDGDEIWTRQ